MLRSLKLKIASLMVMAAAATAGSAQAQSSPPAGTTSANPPPMHSGRYLGCFADRRQRDLTGPHALQASPQACIAFCAEQEFRFASLQGGTHCYCGDSYGRYGSSKACLPCAGRPDEHCGGPWANAVWELSGRMTRLPLPPTLLPPVRKSAPTASTPAK